MKSYPILFLALALCFPALQGCGGSDEEDVAREAAEEATREANDAVAGANEAAEALSNMFGGTGERAETVDFRSLRDLLPGEAAGLERTDISGEKTGAMGFSVSTSKAEYGQGDERVTLQISDTGGMGGLGMMGLAWFRMEFDRESDSGYERTTRFEGYPAYEKQEESGRLRSELQFIVGERFLVGAEGRGVDVDRLKRAVRAVDLDELEDMRDEGRAES